MQIIRENRPYEDYLQAKTPVNRDEARVSFVAQHLMGRVTNVLESGTPDKWLDPETVLVKLTYEYVRDKIMTSTPENSAKLTWRASDVLSEHEGTSYAKANLLAALLRRNGIPTGFAYQYRRDSAESPLVLQALNAVYLESLGGWLRLDASFEPANPERSLLAVDPSQLAQADPDALVQPVRPELGEDNLPIVYAEPDRQLSQLVKQAGSLADFWTARPDRLSEPGQEPESESDESEETGHSHGHHHAHGHDHNSAHPHGHNHQHSHSPVELQAEATESDPDDGLLDLLYGDPDDESFCSGGCKGCSGCH